MTPPPPSAPSASLPLVLLLGNPNVGKSTLFNALSGQRVRVGNYPGVTVERKTAKVDVGGGKTIDLADVPGAYSLSARSKEERIAIDAILGTGGNRAPALCVAVLDAGQLTRNLYMLLQMIELEIPTLVVLNMVDECERPPSAAAVTAQLGLPCVSTNGRDGAGLDDLRRAIAAALEARPKGSLPVAYPSALLGEIRIVEEAIPGGWVGSSQSRRALAMWALTSLDDDDEVEDVPEALRGAVRRLREQAPGRDVDLEIIGARYGALDALTPQLFDHPADAKRTAGARKGLSERVDRILLHPAYGFATFVTIMLVVFQSLFSWADPAIGWIEALVALCQELAMEALPEGFFRSLLVEGILGGVGNVVVFLPQLVLLFLFVGFMEATGYMARVAYLMDRIMRWAGLHGRAFVPIMSGMACAIPAIMATRTMERERDRILTMLVIPLMTCSARLPVYGLLIAALFPPSDVFGFVPVQGLLMVGMYLFSTVMALLAAAVLGRTAVRGRRVPLLLELPRYRWPKPSGVARLTWERARLFLTEAGTTILVFTIGLWLLLSFPEASVAPQPGVAPEAERAVQIENSYAGRIGRAIEPAIAPLGFDWKIGVGLIGAFAAREVFVSTMGLVYGVGEVDEEAEPLRDKMRAETRSDGQPAYSPLVGLSLMVFFALACQCMSTLAVVRRETRGWKWPLFLLGYMTTLAYVASLLVYQGGRALGF